MYPIHKYLPTSFGTYLMHIENDPKQVTVSTVPNDVKRFKTLLKTKTAEQALKQLRAGQQNHIVVGEEKNKNLKLKEAANLQPLYQKRFLQHTGQTVVDPTNDVMIVDQLTGAEVTNGASWMRNRPKPWKELVKIHETENPLLTSTVIRPARIPATKQPDYTAGKRLLQRAYRQDVVAYKPCFPIHKFETIDKIKSEMLPHLPKAVASKNKEQRLLREAAAHKRRRRADKIMHIVGDRAKASVVKAWDDPVSDVTTNAGTKTAAYLRGEYHLPRTLVQTSQSFGGKTVSNIPANTIHQTELGHFKAPKNIDPKEDQIIINRHVLERLEGTMPYRWKGGGNPINNVTTMSNNYTHVL